MMFRLSQKLAMLVVLMATGMFLGAAGPGCIAPARSMVGGVADAASGATPPPDGAPTDLNQQTGLVNALVKLAASLEANFEANVEIDAALARVDELETTIAAVQTNMRDFNVGGDGDSITSWILAFGAVLSGLIYPVILRPLGLRLPSPADRAIKR